MAEDKVQLRARLVQADGTLVEGWLHGQEFTPDILPRDESIRLDRACFVCGIRIDRGTCTDGGPHHFPPHETAPAPQNEAARELATLDNTQRELGNLSERVDRDAKTLWERGEAIKKLQELNNRAAALLQSSRVAQPAAAAADLQEQISTWIREWATGV